MNISTLTDRYVPMLPLFACPICAHAFSLRKFSLVCENGHCFDFNKKGYLNLIPSHLQEKNKYNAALFDARQAIFADGFYQPVLHAVTDLLNQLYGSRPFSLLDVGCGEGYYARSIAGIFSNATVFGCDISPDAIRLAAKSSSSPLWLISDLKHLPFANQSLNVLLDILTPSDYCEFKRVAKDHLIKVIPGDHYLQEIRQLAGTYLSGGENYSNQAVVRHMEESCTILSHEHITSTCPLSPSESQAFLHMTPMTFSVPEEMLAKALLTEITIDMDIYLCKC